MVYLFAVNLHNYQISNIISFIFIQCDNILYGIVFTVAGIVILSNAVQLPKHVLPMFVTVSGISIFFKDVQLSNA